MTRMYKPRGNGIRDIREVSGEFFLSVQDAWRKYGDEILEKVALNFPELFFAGMIKLCQVTKGRGRSAKQFCAAWQQGNHRPEA